jgi:hypothetical protein
MKDDNFLLDKDIVYRLRWHKRGPCLDAADEIERLRAELVSSADELAATLRELREVEAERDEARREVCDMEGETAGGALLEARKRGWDCFKEDKR